LAAVGLDRVERVEVHNSLLVIKAGRGMQRTVSESSNPSFSE
jgi:hypothetical protein